MLESIPELVSLLVCRDELAWRLEIPDMVVGEAERVVGVDVTAAGSRLVVWWALIGVNSVSGC